MTPTSPVVASAAFPGAVGRSASVTRGPAPMKNTTPMQKVDTLRSATTSPGQRTLQPSPALSADRRQALPTTQLPALVLEKVDGSFDNENPLPPSHFQDLDVDGFFSFVSEVTTKPRELFDKLTFTFLFEKGADRIWIINAGDEAAWNKLQNKAEFLYNLREPMTKKSTLLLVVEFGDKTAVNAE